MFFAKTKFETIFKKSLNKGLENKIMELKRKLDSKTEELKLSEEKVARAAENGALTGKSCEFLKILRKYQNFVTKISSFVLSVYLYCISVQCVVQTSPHKLLEIGSDIESCK